ncbi:MAG: hypothetical protein M5R36_22120 [Deltaproteobacteria bacterium]|nr:hypothetical protein [Deltaproteobacteria bacterium]
MNPFGKTGVRDEAFKRFLPLAAADQRQTRPRKTRRNILERPHQRFVPAAGLDSAHHPENGFSVRRADLAQNRRPINARAKTLRIHSSANHREALVRQRVGLHQRFFHLFAHRDAPVTRTEEPSVAEPVRRVP